jgi:hypothetical protein
MNEIRIKFVGKIPFEITQMEIEGKIKIEKNTWHIGTCHSQICACNRYKYGIPNEHRRYTAGHEIVIASGGGKRVDYGTYYIVGGFRFEVDSGYYIVPIRDTREFKDIIIDFGLDCESEKFCSCTTEGYKIACVEEEDGKYRLPNNKKFKIDNLRKCAQLVY